MSVIIPDKEFELPKKRVKINNLGLDVMIKAGNMTKLLTFPRILWLFLFFSFINFTD